MRGTRRMSASALADIYQQLRRMEEAGLPPARAFSLLHLTDRRARDCVLQIQRKLQSGRSVAAAMMVSGLFPRADGALLVAGEQGGKLGAVYRQLADSYRAISLHSRHIKSRLYLPLLLVLIAMLVRPLPALIAGDLSPVGYAAAGIGRFAALLFLLFSAARLPFWLTEGNLAFLGLGSLVYRLQYRTPVYSTWLIERQCHQFFRNLELLLEAGLAASEAVGHAVECIRNPLLRAGFSRVSPRLRQGESLVDALAEVPQVDSRALRLLRSGEASGKLVETLNRYNRSIAEELERKERTWAEWIPRMLYTAVALWIAL